MDACTLLPGMPVAGWIDVSRIGDTQWPWHFFTKAGHSLCGRYRGRMSKGLVAAVPDEQRDARCPACLQRRP